MKKKIIYTFLNIKIILSFKNSINKNAQEIYTLKIISKFNKEI